MTTETTTRAEALKALVAYCGIRRHERAIKREKDTAAGLIRAYLEQTGEELVDGERGITARLQERHGAPQLDAANASTEALRWLADHGCLKLDYETFKTLPDKFAEALDIKRMLMPGGLTIALEVKEAR